MDYNILKSFFASSAAVYRFRRYYSAAIGKSLEPTEMERLHMVALAELKKDAPDEKVLSGLLDKMEKLAGTNKAMAAFPFQIGGAEFSYFIDENASEYIVPPGKIHPPEHFVKEIDDLLARLCDSVVDSGEITPAEILEKYPAIAAKYETEKANDVDGGEHIIQPRQIHRTKKEKELPEPGKDVILKTKNGQVRSGRGIADDDGFYFAVLAVNGGVTHIDPDRVAKWVYAEDAFDLLTERG